MAMAMGAWVSAVKQPLGGALYAGCLRSCHTFRLGDPAAYEQRGLRWLLGPLYTRALDERSHPGYDPAHPPFWEMWLPRVTW